MTVPDDERIDVIPTPEYLRNVIPFAAYFEPATFDRDPKGIYIVTPSIDDDPSAMREHNYASISNTSIHEAYPGHHLQLDVARRNPLADPAPRRRARVHRGLGDVLGADDARARLRRRRRGFRLVMHTDAIWRACRIILDVRMHRGELSVEEATDFLIEHTRFERPNAAAEVDWYTYRPTYPLSYLLGRTLLLGLRADEQRRLGDAFSLKAFHDTLLRNGSLPVSFHRRLLTAEGADRVMEVIPAIDVEAGRSRIVFWPGAGPASARRPTGPTASPSGSWPWAHESSSSSISRARAPGRRPTWTRSARSRHGSPSRSRSPAASTRPRRSSLAFAAGATRVVLTTAIADRPDDLRACLAVAGDWLAVGLDPRPERLAAFPWRRAAPPTVDGLIGELVGAGVAPVRADPRRRRAGPRRAPATSFGRTMRRSWWPGASTTSTASAACATPAWPASSSVRRFCPEPSTIPQPWRPPHDAHHDRDRPCLSLSRQASSRIPAAHAQRATRRRGDASRSAAARSTAASRGCRCWPAG